MQFQVFDHRKWSSFSVFDIVEKFGRAKQFLHVDFGQTPTVTVAEEYYQFVQKVLENPQEICDKTSSSPSLVWSVLLNRYGNEMSEELKLIIRTVMIIPLGSAEG